MIVSRLQLFCDREGCKAFFPPEGPVDGAIYSHSDLRIAAAQHDWKRRGSPRLDMCPVHGNAALRKKDGR